MTKPIRVSAVLLLLASTGAIASPKPCRDAQGRVVPCPKPAKPQPQRCKDANGRFVPCAAKGVSPVG